MGKPEDDEFYLPSTAIDAQRASGSSARGRECSCFRLKCFLVLLLGISVFLSALFWLPPFSTPRHRGDPDLDPRYRGHAIVASFILPKPIYAVKENYSLLESNIYDELEAADSRVNILSLESIVGRNGSNETQVVFAMDPASEHSSISTAEQSLIRSDFEFLVTGQQNLQLTSLLQDLSLFEVLKFPGGITINPPQYAYPLQQVQIKFNFTLNNSIYQILANFQDLKDQLKSGLHLTDNENLYIRLTNSRGSTVAPPTTVLTSVVLRVGVPSAPRLKQLAQTIRDSPAKNLGLNNTVFGKVKQISLSSILQHSLSGDASSPAMAPSPLPHHHHHHHHHHDYRRPEGHSAYLPPASAPRYSPTKAPSRPVRGALAPQRSASSPMRSHRATPLGAPSPSPVKSYLANPPAARAPVRSYHASPPRCRFRFKHRHISESPVQPPTSAPHHSTVLPHPKAKSPIPVAHRISPTSPLPNVVYARVPPPTGTKMDPEPPAKMPLIAPSISAGGRIPITHLAFSLLLVLIFDLW